MTGRKSLLTLLLPYLFIAPTLILVFVFTLWPTAQSVIASLYRPGRGLNPAVYVGLQNYIDLFTPDHFLGGRFVQIFSNTLIFTGATVVVCLPLSLLFALLLNRVIRWRSVWRFSLIYPALLPFIGAASLWAFLFADTIGLINAVLHVFGLGSPNWIGDPALVLGAVTTVNIWKQTSYFAIFFLAGLQGIPKDVYEAADLDGASAWQTLRYLTLPLLRRTIFFVLLIAITFGFQTVEQLPALGQGGPGDSSNLLLYFIFQTIPERRNWGYVNAMTVLLLIVLLIFTITSFRAFEGGPDDEKA